MSTSAPQPPRAAVEEHLPARTILGVFLRLGLTSFGGPAAHLGYFHREFVERRRWLDERSYADLVALCQLLPGPASSQLGFAVGLQRGGWRGGLAAWAGFTFPSAALMIAFAYGVGELGDWSRAGWLHGLKIAAVAVVAQAVWLMARKLCPDRGRATLAVTAAGTVLLLNTAWSQIAVIATGALIAWKFLPRTAASPATQPPPPDDGVAPGKRNAWVCLALFAVLLVALPMVTATGIAPAWLRVFDSFYRAGSLVFGGGHVVLPLLQAEVVPPGWVTPDQFLAGYGAAQAVPGPLFSFAAYLGTLTQPGALAWLSGLGCLLAVFLPALLLVAGVLPFWDRLRHRPALRCAMDGANAAVVGVLLAALYDPVWTNAVLRPRDFAVSLAAFSALHWWKVPAWAVVVLCALTGWWLGR